jgi:hypothetical protein
MGGKSLTVSSPPRSVHARFGKGPQKARWAWLGQWRLGLLTALLLLLGYGFMILHGADRAPGRKSAQQATAPAWVEVPNPRQIFRLEAPEFVGVPEYYEARQHRVGGGRQDVVGYGGSDDTALLRLIVYQPGQEAAPSSSFFVELVRRAAETGRAITRATQPAALVTRFGTFEAAELTLARDGGSGRDCFGFRFASSAPNLRISGFACGGVTSRSGLACLIDRIGVATLVADGDLIAFFGAPQANSALTCREATLPPMRRLSKS